MGSGGSKANERAGVASAEADTDPFPDDSDPGLQTVLDDPDEVHARSVLVEELRISELAPIASQRAERSRSDRTAHRAEAERAGSRELPAGTVVGEYEIERKIGEGGMGTVYVAIHPVLGKRAAIKVISDDMSRDGEALARFRREARAVAQLASPHIVDVFGFGELADGRSYYAMEYLTGESLRDRLNRGRIPLDEALELLDHIVRGLEVAHAAGIVHRDLKPENMFIERGGARPIVKLLDFGLVKLAASDDGIAKTQIGMMFGTPLYIAPEQIRSAASVDQRADIYSLGCVAFELVLGRVPFVRATPGELIAAHLEVEPPAPRDLWRKIPSALDAMLRAMLAKNPVKRPTLGHVLDVLEKLRATATSTTSWRRSVAGILESRASQLEAPALGAPLVRAPLASSAVPSAVANAPATTDTVAMGARRAMIAGAAVVAVVVAVVSLAAVMMRSSSGDGETAAGALPAPTTPQLSTVTVEPLPSTPVAAPAPAAAVKAAVTPPVVVVAKPAVPTPRVVTKLPTPTPTPIAASAPIAESTPVVGELYIGSKPPCDVSVDGQATGRQTPIAHFALAPGSHRVTLSNPAYSIAETTIIDVSAGKTTRVVKDYTAKLHAADPNGTIDPFGGH